MWYWIVFGLLISSIIGVEAQTDVHNILGSVLILCLVIVSCLIFAVIGIVKCCCCPSQDRVEIYSRMDTHFYPLNIEQNESLIKS